MQTRQRRAAIWIALMVALVGGLIAWVLVERPVPEQRVAGSVERGLEPLAPPTPAEALAAKVEAFYGPTADFTAEFEQTFHARGTRKSFLSSGTVEAKKPSFMRWHYAKPYEKQLVADGTAVWLWEPDDRFVQVTRTFSNDLFTVPITFLGGGHLSDAHELALTTKAGLEGEVLELTPKKPQSGVGKLYFAVDAATGAVRTMIVVDPQGNENRFDFSEMKTNVGLDAKRFTFTPPKGATVQELK